MAAEVSPLIYDYFVGRFGVEDPLPKEDMVAVKHHKFAAMENWGLMTFA